MPKLLELMVESIGILEDILFNLEELELVLDSSERVLSTKESFTDIENKQYMQLMEQYADTYIQIQDLLNKLN